MTQYTLRPYQRDAVQNTINHFRQSDEAAVIVLPTGAGKSLVIAELARIAKGRVMVITHVKELVEQNHDKYESYGLTAGIFSAGLKQKNLDHQVTFASIQSLARNLDAVKDQYSLLIIDECHRISNDDNSQYQQTITHLKKLNPTTKLLGLTATPYRMGLGWIYQFHHRGYCHDSQKAPFKHCIYELPLRYMIKSGFLTEPNRVDATIDQYDFSAIVPDSFGNLPEKPVNELLKSCTRVTKAITKQIEELAESRQGVMIFAATVKHAEEIYSYLPPNLSALITGKTDGLERDELIQAFKHRELKFLVNVSVLTTGFDAPHVDMIAILRPTHSVSLYQQIVGRGLRISEGKTDCLIIDYAGNQFDIYHPEVGQPKSNPKSEPVQVFCPLCGFANLFWGIKDSDGQIVEHYGRRCQATEAEDNGIIKQCNYRFRFKTCLECGCENDIAARSCHSCGHAIVDPDEQLKRALQLKDAMVLRCAGLSFRKDSSKLVVTYHGEEGEEVSERFDFSKPTQLKRFNQLFGRRFRDGQHPTEFSSLETVLENELAMPCPDFVVARKAGASKSGHFWRVQERVFDYKGRYRKAHQLN